MSKKLKYVSIGIVALFLVLGIGASFANAALTLEALTVSSSGVLNLNGEASSNINLGSTTTTGNIIIGGGLTTGKVGIGTTAVTPYSKVEVINTLTQDNNDYYGTFSKILSNDGGHSNWQGLNGLAGYVNFDASSSTNWKAMRSIRAASFVTGNNNSVAWDALFDGYLGVSGTNNTISDMVGLRISSEIAATNTVTTFKGVSIENQSGINPTKNFGIYVGTGFNNYFGGNVGIGTTAPISQLHVVGMGAFGNETPATQDGYVRISKGGVTREASLVYKAPGQEWQLGMRWNTNNGYGIYDETGGAYRFFIAPTTGNIGIGTTNPGASNLLELSSTTKGFVLPRMTKVQRDAIASPVAGMAVYQTDNTPGLRVYNGTNWMRYTETAD